MSPYKHLTLIDRELILIGLKTNLTQAEIAQQVGCSKSTISREIKRNGGSENYRATTAQEHYQKARLASRRPRLLTNSVLRMRVIDYLTHRHWSPEQIAGRLAHEKFAFKISYNTIYRGIERDNLGLPRKSHGARGIARKLRHRGKTRKVKGTLKERRGRFNDTASIHDRPLSAENRNRFGHWEADTVRGKTGHSALVTVVDRKSRLLLAQRVSKVNSNCVKQALIDLLQTITPSRVRTITPDRGTEFAQYQAVSTELDAQVYFPDPHAPYQRGTNENTNGLIREYFPKGTELDQQDDQTINAFVEQLNNRPRKVLGWKTPNEVFYGWQLHLT